ncbi:MAG: hypothetical protein KatS3mg130_2002 [Candidatus Sumerlaea sp.]|nr:MAG: hypothetical protein KatS3mg130_2002 [Candidatus Sumerlaea sp.]
MDAVTLSRLQFALTVAFHYIFVPLSIGLGAIMVIVEAMYLKTRLKVYENMARFWTRIFAVTFAMGVASGIVMEFQFGTNWATYSRFVGDVFGSALAAEGIFAFFLESGFLAVLVFGWDRVSPRVHFLFHAHGEPWLDFLGGLDYCRELMAADAGRVSQSLSTWGNDARRSRISGKSSSIPQASTASPTR